MDKKIIKSSLPVKVGNIVTAKVYAGTTSKSTRKCRIVQKLKGFYRVNVLFRGQVLFTECIWPDDITGVIK